MVPGADGPGGDAGGPRERSRLHVHADGRAHRPSGRRTGGERLTRAVAHAGAARAGEGPVTTASSGSTRSGTPIRARTPPRTPSFLSAADGEVDGEQRLLPGHHGRSGRGQAARAGDAAAVARAGDGLADRGRAVRQRVRVRVSEQPVVVVADHAAAGRGASARGVRAAVRRWRHFRGTRRRRCGRTRACSIG